MPLQTVWAWTFVAAANSNSSGPTSVSGSLEVHIPSQFFAYIATALQNFQIFQPPANPESFGDPLVDANPSITAVNGAPQQAGATVAFGNIVQSVNFAWTLSLGRSQIAVAPYQASAQFLFQILGSG